MLYAEWSVQQQVDKALDGTPMYGPPPCENKACTHAVGSRGCIADDRELIKLANPSAGRSAAPSIGWDFLEEERREVGADPELIEAWFRERLSAGDEGHAASTLTIFGPAAIWQAGRTLHLPDGTAAVGVAMTADRLWISLVGASVVEVPDPDDDEAEPVDRLIVAPILHTQDVPGAVALLLDLQERTDAIVTYDEKGPAAALFEDPDDDDPAAEIAAEPMSLGQYATASSRFYDRVTAMNRRGEHEPTLLHLENADLDAHVGRAEWRWVGDHRIISRRDGQDAVDASLLEAAIVAARQAELFGSTFNIA